tara:strand:+ start:218 stop:1090 length:873 start_codon:yes stop_codon:yes gene_type:complete
MTVNSDNFAHYVWLEVEGSDKGDLITGRIGLKCDTVQITTSKTAPVIPIPGSGFVTGKSENIAIDTGMADKQIQLSGIITEQVITKNFTRVRAKEDSAELNSMKTWATTSGSSPASSNVNVDSQTNLIRQPSVYMTAQEVAQLIHSYVDSSFRQDQQNMSKLVFLYPSRVNKFFMYHNSINEFSLADYQISQTGTGANDGASIVQTNAVSSFTDVADLPLVPFNFNARRQDNEGVTTLFEDSFPDPISPSTGVSDSQALSGVIQNFDTTFDLNPYITFSMSFKVATTITL